MFAAPASVIRWISLATCCAGFAKVLTSFEPVKVLMTNCTLVEPQYRPRDKHALHLTLPDAIKESQQLRTQFKVRSIWTLLVSML